jgi:hypothetical protein
MAKTTTVPAGASPKQRRSESGWYSYYAGFSLKFASQAIASLQIERGSTILDPWSGAGTTLVAARANNLRGIGVDANPALVLVARGRILGPEVRSSLRSLTEDLLEHARTDSSSTSDDPLEQWVDAESASRLRAFERALQKLLVDPKRYVSVKDRGVAGMSSLAAYFYVVAFEVARSWAVDAQSSNPTWFKQQDGGTHTVSWSEFASQIRATQSRLSAATVVNRPRAAPSSSLLGNSMSLPVKDHSCQAALTSPPYLTRIDYVIATLPELAVLGYGRADASSLRDLMIGTPTIAGPHVDEVPARWGPRVGTFLGSVRAHPSKASSSYYLKTFAQYFAGMAASIDELGRAVEPGGSLILIVQDSYYKEIRIDLANLLTDLACQSDWEVVRQLTFDIPRTIASINPGARKYRSEFSSSESVVQLRRLRVN